MRMTTTKTCILTGSTQGIGRAAACALAKQGLNLALVCRDEAKGEALAAELRKAGAAGKIDVLVCDFSSQQSIRAAAAEALRRYPRIDILANNAGAIFTSRKTTADGLEATFATNHLGYFLFTNLLLDRLKASAPARIVNVASAAHGRASMHFDDLQLEKGWSSFGAYGQSKLANILFTFELARRLEGTGVTANCLHPGVVRTNFGRTDGGFLNIAIRIGGLFFLTPEQGADTLVWLCTSPEVEGVTGRYYAKRKPARSNRESHDAQAAQRLWDVSGQLTGLA